MGWTRETLLLERLQLAARRVACDPTFLLVGVDRLRVVSRERCQRNLRLLHLVYSTLLSFSFSLLDF